MIKEPVWKWARRWGNQPGGCKRQPLLTIPSDAVDEPAHCDDKEAVLQAMLYSMFKLASAKAVSFEVKKYHLQQRTFARI